MMQLAQAAAENGVSDTAKMFIGALVLVVFIGGAYLAGKS